MPTPGVGDAFGPATVDPTLARCGLATVSDATDAVEGVIGTLGGGETGAARDNGLVGDVVKLPAVWAKLVVPAGLRLTIETDEQQHYSAEHYSMVMRRGVNRT